MNIGDFYKIFTVNDPIKGRRLKTTSLQGIDSNGDPLTLSDSQGGRRIKVELDAYPSVATYADLPTASDYPNRIYAVLTSTGTKWIPGWLGGGDFYPKGFYLSNGTTWSYMGEFPNQATQSQVDAGVLSDVFVSPLTLKNDAKWNDYVPVTRTLTINGVSYDLSSDRSWTVSSGSGTVTSVSAGTGMSFTTITGSGSISIDNSKVPYYSSGFSSGLAKYNGSSWIIDTNTYLTSISGLNISLLNNDSGYITSSALTAYVPYSGATSDVDLGNYNLSAKSLLVTGTGGNGHIHLKHQSSDSAATGSSTVLFANSVGNIKYKNDGGNYVTFVTNSISADRSYTFQDANGTLAFLSDIPSLTGYVPTSRTLTINGTSYDLSSDRSWTINSSSNSDYNNVFLLGGM